MAIADNAYSRFIALAKILLPLAALALLSTLFLFSRDRGSGQPPDTTVDLDAVAREQRLGAPDFAGVTGDGTAVSVRAQTARPDPLNPGRATVTSVRARLDMPDQRHVDIAADHGVVDKGAGTLVLEGAVEIRTSEGYDLRSERMVSALDATDVVSDVPISADGPIGRLEAGAMHLKEDPGAPGQYLLDFKNGVRLIYEPKD